MSNQHRNQPPRRTGSNIPEHPHAVCSNETNHQAGEWVSADQNRHGDRLCQHTTADGRQWYHYQNTNGSIYYRNPDTSAYYNDGHGNVWYTDPVDPPDEHQQHRMELLPSTAPATIAHETHTPFFGDQYGDPFEQEIHLPQAVHAHHAWFDFLDTEVDEDGLIDLYDPEDYEDYEDDYL